MYQKELEAMIAAAKLAEVKIKEIYSKPFEVEIKSDDSPVTAADKAADAIIRESLGKQFPDYGFLTEESVDTPERLSKRCIFIVDPVDGTKEFVAHNGEFTTNIALAVDKEVVAG
ncbi:MAG: inositol monophosphatase family protein, partial [Bacillota bacterium]|nr:inositol monophosphatase family protein [Bacillota bacterium]